MTNISLDDICGAFSLGWSLVELRSRVAIAVFTNLGTDPLPEPTSQSAGKDSPITVRMTSALNLIANLKEVLFLNGVLDETKKSSTYQPFSKQPVSLIDSLTHPKEPNDAVWMASVWQTVFQRLTSLHLKYFPKSNAQNTIYDPLSSFDDLKTVYPYLSGNISIGIPDIPGTPSFDARQFGLYDLTQRALNCLAILFMTGKNGNVENSLISGTLQSTWDSLKSEMNKYFSNSKDIRIPAVALFGGLILLSLNAWDGFLRESFSWGDILTNNTLTNGTPTGNTQTGEIELRAYEAGRALASFSWGVSTRLVPLENILAGAPPSDALKDLLKNQVKDVWGNAFNRQDITYIQDQISALSTALDDAYPGKKQTAPAGPSQPPAPDLPSLALQAIKRSLDYWQRVAEDMCGAAGLPQDSSVDLSKLLDWDVSRRLRQALVRQSHLWQSFIMGQQPLSSLNTDRITQTLLSGFMNDLGEALQGWKNELGDFLGKALQFGEVELGDLKNDLVKASQDWKNELNRFTRNSWVWFVLGVAVLIGLVIASFAFPNLAPTFSLLVGLIFGFIGSTVNTVRTTFSSLFHQQPARPVSDIKEIIATASAHPAIAPHTPLIESLNNIVGGASNMISTAFQDAAQRLLVEFGDLNRAVSVSTPLITFLIEEQVFGLNNNLVKNSYQCLTQIFWTPSDRDEEIQNMVYAAFGPIGAFVASQNTGGGSSPTPTTSGNQLPASSTTGGAAAPTPTH